MPALTTVQWKEIEKHYRVGKRTLRDIGEEFGVAHVTISKKAKKLGWVRDLNAALNAKADEILQKQALENSATKEGVTGGG